MSDPHDPDGQPTHPPTGHPAPPPAYAPAPPVAPPRYASWGTRVVVYLWDYIVYPWPAWLLLVAGYTCLGIGAAAGEGAGTALGIVGGLLVLAGLVVALWRGIRNVILDQGRTGYTYGRRKTGTRCLREQDGQPMGVGVAVGRYFLHVVINYACYIDYLWPLWDPKNQTLTDKVLTTVVIQEPR